MIYKKDYTTIKVLLADDDPDILALTSWKVTQEGFSVVTAIDGEDAWDKIKSENPDVIVLDLRMPKLHGLDVVKRLRENPPVKNKWQPVIIVSGERDMSTLNEIFKYEADHYLKKPCTAAEVVQAIKLMVSLIPPQQT